MKRLITAIATLALCAPALATHLDTLNEILADGNSQVVTVPQANGDIVELIPSMFILCSNLSQRLPDEKPSIVLPLSATKTRLFFWGSPGMGLPRKLVIDVEGQTLTIYRTKGVTEQETINHIKRWVSGDLTCGK